MSVWIWPPSLKSVSTETNIQALSLDSLERLDFEKWVISVDGFLQNKDFIVIMYSKTAHNFGHEFILGVDQNDWVKVVSQNFYS